MSSYHHGCLTEPPQSETGLPAGWEVRHSNSRKLPYYFNSATKDSRWEPPAGTDTERLKDYMATHHSTSAPTANQTADDVNGRASEDKIRAAHLLVKHRDSRRPTSWRESNITRTQAEAREIIEAHKARIESGETTLQELATKESDCPSARKRGDLYVLRGIGVLKVTTGTNVGPADISGEETCKRNSKLLHSICSQSK